VLYAAGQVTAILAVAKLLPATFSNQMRWRISGQANSDIYSICASLLMQPHLLLLQLHGD